MLASPEISAQTCANIGNPMVLKIRGTKTPCLLQNMSGKKKGTIVYLYVVWGSFFYEEPESGIRLVVTTVLHGDISSFQ